MARVPLAACLQRVAPLEPQEPPLAERWAGSPRLRPIPALARQLGRQLARQRLPLPS